MLRVRIRRRNKGGKDQDEEGKKEEGLKRRILTSDTTILIIHMSMFLNCAPDSQLFHSKQDVGIWHGVDLFPIHTSISERRVTLVRTLGVY